VRTAASADPVSPISSTWARRCDVTLTLFLWLVLAVAGLWVATALLRPLLIVALAALLAYAISPAVRPWFVSRRRERWWPLPAY
jgi:predicted PurR-regulated permease PerM